VQSCGGLMTRFEAWLRRTENSRRCLPSLAGV
jgi:hypothetical protein